MTSDEPDKFSSIKVYEHEVKDSDFEEPNEEQREWIQKRIPNDPYSQKLNHKENELINSANLECLKCKSHSNKDYDPPITYSEFIEDKPKLICPQCKSVLSSIPLLLNGEWNGNVEQIEKTPTSKVTKEDIDFLFETMTKEAKYDVISVKQLALGMFSAFTKIPIPHNCNSKNSGAGKSYLTNGVADYFPNQHVFVLVGASDKAFHHRQGSMVIKDKESGELREIEPIVKVLNEEICGLESSNDKNVIKNNKKRIKEIESEIQSLHRRAQKLIDLDNTIIILQDTPQDTLFDTLMSLLSQEDWSGRYKKNIPA